MTLLTALWVLAGALLMLAGLLVLLAWAAERWRWR
jgi:hypothetical protein